ncbi:MAG: Txe/YoeB family addiction module toxin [Verrucomicrobiaceae bacterium]|nr:Txe/YoeB family addiction module toxin [Verrucomicrobiaceae bacterium]
MNLLFSDEAWADYLHWQNMDRRALKRINELIKDIQRSPFIGIGKPEPLKHQFAGLWSRRIDGEHRLLYRVKDDRVEIVSCRLHYK